MAVLSDEEAASLAVESFASPSTEQQVAYVEVSRLLHGRDESPFVDVHELFACYNVLYFRGLLLPRVEVSWSGRMTLCAGICELLKDDEGKYRRVRLKLSEPLLKYRPQSDTVNTLLHEAIHAYFFITSSWRHARNDDPSGHGAGFQMLASAINHHGSYDITIYHTFHDEVDSYRTHIWQCSGPCKKLAPFFGLVKRSMNRAPGRSDSWWSKHEEQCGGKFTKIAEPEPTKEQVKNLSRKERAGLQKNKIDGWIRDQSTHRCHTPNGQSSLGTSDVEQQQVSQKAGLRKRSYEEDESSSRPIKKILATVSCPICEMQLRELDINLHLDTAHNL